MIVATPWCCENISKDWSVDDIKKNGFNGYVFDFELCLWHNWCWWYFRHPQVFDEKEWHSIIKCLGLLKSVFLQD